QTELLGHHRELCAIRAALKGGIDDHRETALQRGSSALRQALIGGRIHRRVIDTPTERGTRSVQPFQSGETLTLDIGTHVYGSKRRRKALGQPGLAASGD